LADRNVLKKSRLTLIQHLIELTEMVLSRKEGLNPFDLRRPVYEELQKLDAGDFEQAKRADFIAVKGQFERLANPWPHETTTGSKLYPAFAALKEILPFYRGQGSRLLSKPFSFTSDPQLAAIIRADYSELHLRVIPSGACKCMAILAGSILEAILYDIMASAKNAANADAFAKGHAKFKNLGSISSGRWTLEPLIEGAVALKLLQPEDSKVIDQTLRDYRNFIHPMKQLRSAFTIDDNRAALAVRALDIVIDHLEATYRP
jgi:hypothetical protein